MLERASTIQSHDIEGGSASIRLTREFKPTTITIVKDQHIDRRKKRNDPSVTPTPTPNVICEVGNCIELLIICEQRGGGGGGTLDRQG